MTHGQQEGFEAEDLKYKYKTCHILRATAVGYYLKRIVASLKPFGLVSAVLFAQL